MHQSVIEVGTSVCGGIKEVKEEVKKLRRDMIFLAKENGLRLASAATHPFADWRAQEITQDDRYKNIVEDLQLVARQPDLRAACAHRSRGSRNCHSPDESCPVFSSPYSCSFQQLAILAGNEYRVKILSLQSF
jgi:hypothetical protein